MILYFIKSTFLLLIFFSIYRFSLQDKKSLQFNRFYLLIALVLGLVLPLFNFSFFVESNSIIETKEIVFQQIEGFSDFEYFPMIQKESLFSNLEILFIGIVIFLTIRFVFRVYLIIRLKRSGQQIKNDYGRLILHSKVKSPFSFLKSIYLNLESWNSGLIEKEILIHEQGHVVQKHSLDIMFIEFLKIGLWFQPMLYFYKKAIQENHEFLADAYCLQQTTNINAYQNIILNYYSEQNKRLDLSSSIDYKNLKKRFMMMKNTKKGNVTKVLFYSSAFVLTYFGLVGIETKANTIEKFETQILNNVNLMIDDKISNSNLQTDEKIERHSIKENNDEVNVLEYVKGVEASGFFHSKKYDAIFFYIISPQLEVSIFNREGVKQDEKEFNYKLKEVTKEEQIAKLSSIKDESSNKESVFLQYVKGQKSYGYIKFQNDSYYYIISPELEVSIYNRYGVIQDKSDFKYDLKEISKEENESNLVAKEIEAFFNIRTERITKNSDISSEVPMKVSVSGKDITKASPKEGFQKFYSNFMKATNAPDVDENLEIKVVIKMLIDEEGKLTNFEIVNKSAANESFENEFLRVMKTMPQWNPATKDGKAIASDFYLPITIKVAKETNSDKVLGN